MTTKRTNTRTRDGWANGAAVGAAVCLRGLHKRYGQVRAVDGVDLLITSGEVVALLGPNGAGKSTTVDMLLGLTKSDAGEVLIFGQQPRAAVRAGAVGAMLQGGAVLDEATVAESVGLIAALHNAPMPVAEALRRAGVEDIAGRRRSKLSGGQKQRVRFALALVCDPDLLVLDEPTVAMDVETRRVLGRDAGIHGVGPHGAVRHPLPGGGRGVRRPSGVAARGEGHRGRLRGAGTCRGVGANTAGRRGGRRSRRVDGATRRDQRPATG